MEPWQMSQQSQQASMNAQQMAQQAQQSAMNGMRMGNEAGRMHQNAMASARRAQQIHQGGSSGGGVLSGLLGMVAFVVMLVIAYTVVTGDTSFIPR
ncbi:hypothetical protein ABZ208_27890 [Streptomyces sp. NPDC006208]|uniref:hypothetical protein n=1 Tax=Streptomyces sp. NPDC006208 TaxID=3156734 RepID=UPI0033BD098C